MSTLNTTTVATRPTTLNNTTDVGKSYFETDSNKILVWDGTAWNEWNKDFIVSPGVNNNYSLQLDGTDDHLDCGNNSALDLTSGFTINCFVRQDDTGINTIIQRRTGNNGYQLAFVNGGFEYNGGTGRNFGGGYTSTTDWYMLTVTHTGGTNGTLKGYVNGSLVNTFTDTYTSVTTQNFYIGKNYAGNAFSHNGYIDEVGVWSSVLSAEEISTIYNTGTPIDLTSDTGDYASSSDLVGYWRMGDGSGDTNSGGVTPGNGDTVGTVKNLANPGTHDGTGSGGALYSTTKP